MDIFILLLIALFCFLLAYTYALYPLLLTYLYKKRAKNWEYTRHKLAKQNAKIDFNQLPFVSVLIAAHNEEKVITEKINALLQTDYPYSKIHFFIGSDASTDQTNPILTQFAKQKIHLHFFPFAQRRGKPSVINDLAQAALLYAQKLNIAPNQHVFILNDANVIPSPSAFRLLAQHFVADKKIGLVDSLILPYKAEQKNNQAGVAAAEQTYLSSEAKVKHYEGELWGLMLGAMGGCYALRADLYQPLPPKVLVDDFYIAMAAFAQNIDAVSDLEAICYENNPAHLSDEFRRKTRIATGNFYNLAAFRAFLWYKKRLLLSFVFVSHKVLRWLGGFMIIINYLLTALLTFLYPESQTYFYLFITANASLFLPIILDFLFSKIGLHIRPLRFLAYFLLMNLAFVIGFFRYLRGGNQGIWTPTKR